MTTPATALIAEDEPLLAQTLQAELVLAWPALRVLASVGDGVSAVQQALALQPDVLFFDIRMPGQSGLEAAADLLDAWPGDGAQGKPFPLLVFVTAYDQYAVQAFEAQALDYVLKPVQPQRLQKTVSKLQAALAGRSQTTPDLQAWVQPLRHLLGLGALPGQAAAAPAARLQFIPASVGTAVHLVPVSDIIYLQAADKYVVLRTAQREYLVRTPLKDLLTQLDAQAFWQIHRSTVVQASAIAAVQRDESGRLRLQLQALPGQLPVSRLFAHRFVPM